MARDHDRDRAYLSQLQNEQETKFTASVSLEAVSTLNARDAQRKLADRLRLCADAIDYDNDRAQSVMAP